MESTPLESSVQSAAAALPEVDLGHYLLVCGLLIGLIVVLAWLFRRFVVGALKAKAGARSLAIVDVLPLGGRQRLAVVRCYDRTFALGLGEKEVALVAELDAPPAAAAAAAPKDAAGGAAAAAPDPRAFAQELLRRHAELVEGELAQPPAAGPRARLSEAQRIRRALAEREGVLG